MKLTLPVAADLSSEVAPSQQHAPTDGEDHLRLLGLAGGNIPSDLRGS